MKENKPSLKRILVMSLSNIGDVILTFPVLDILRMTSPLAEIAVVVGPKGAPLLKDNPHFKCIVYDKKQPFSKTVEWLRELRETSFDLILDLRNTAIPFVLKANKRTSPFLARDKGAHMRYQHLTRLRSVYPFEEGTPPRRALTVSRPDREFAQHVRIDMIGRDARFFLVAAGAADHGKRWGDEGFAKVCDAVVERDGLTVVFIGDESDGIVSQRIKKLMTHPAVDLCGKVTLPQLAELMMSCSLLITNDSAPLHLGSYCDIPVLALFGPTDPRRYGPWSSHCGVIEKKKDCPACCHPDSQQRHSCLSAITPEDVLGSFCFTEEGVRFLSSYQGQGDDARF